MADGCLFVAPSNFNFNITKTNPSPQKNPVARQEIKEECLSPEKDTPWVLDAICLEEQYMSYFSTSENHSCGLCGNQVKDLRSLKDTIAKTFEDRFGCLRSSIVSQESLNAVEKRGTCFFPIHP